MKKLMLGLFLLACTLTFAKDKPYYTYTNIQTIGGYPLVGGGVRFIKGKTSLDISANAIPLGTIFFHTKALLLLYPVKGVYLGGGLGLLNEPENVIKGISGSFEGSLGYEWKTKKERRIFVEANAITPFQKPIDGVSRVWPGLTFGYGF